MQGPLGSLVQPMLRSAILFFFFSLLALAGCGTNGCGGPGEAETPEVPRPYTPCCGAQPAPGSLSDPGLPSEGPGPFRFVKTQKTYEDTERSRSILTDVFLPSEDGLSPSDSGGPYPLVVVVHGFSGSKDLMTSYGERLATWGYVALVPTLPCSSFLDVFCLSHTESARDVLFLLNSVCCETGEESSIFFGLVDRSRLGCLGHSLGGKLCALAALMDGSIRAVAGLDPVDGADPAGLLEGDPDFPDLAPALLPDLKIPTLYLGGTEPDSILGLECAPRSQNFHAFWLASPSPAVEIEVQGADHTDFVDQSFLFRLLDPCSTGTADEKVVKDLARKYAVAFFQDRLRGWERFRSDYAGSGVEADAALGRVAWQAK